MPVRGDSKKFFDIELVGKPPAFGHGLKKYWEFSENYVNLNHGMGLTIIWIRVSLTPSLDY
jgi:hypothetical protein